MKKKLFYILSLISFSLIGQSTSFETGEGFSLGPIDGQNGFTVFAGAPAVPVISDQNAFDGTFSLQLASSNSGALAGTFSPTFTSTMDVSLAVDVFIESTASTSSVPEIVNQSPSQGLLTSRVVFDSATDGILILDDPGTGLTFIDSGATFTRDTWFNFRIDHSFSTNQILYYLNNTLIYTGIVYGGTNVEQFLLFMTDNQSNVFFDNVVYQEGPLSVEDNIFLNGVSVYPNPMQDVLNIQNSRQFTETTFVEIYDLLGKVLVQKELNVQNTAINTSDLVTGSYLVKIFNNSTSKTYKLIKN